MAKSVDPDQVLHSVCKGLSVSILRVITVLTMEFEKKKSKESQSLNQKEFPITKTGIQDPILGVHENSRLQ